MLVDGYVRVSTLEQAKEGYSIGAQTERLKAYCLARGWTLHRIYTDPGHSGAKLDRPGLQEMIRDIEKKNVDLVLVYKLDRLSRSQKDTLYLIEDVFLKNGISFVSLNENFDTSTPFGRAMVGILSVFAQLEREQIKERTQMGRIERAKEGLWKGGGAVPVGYEYNPQTNELRLNEYEALQVREVFDMFVNRHYAYNRIARELCKKGYRHKNGGWEYASTIKVVLSNPIYTGRIVWQGESYQGQHKAIISEEIFEEAQKRRSDIAAREGSSFKSTQLLSGILFCKHCGGRYYGAGAYRGSKKLPNHQRNYIHLYSCYSRTKTKKEMIRDPNCKNKNWKAIDLDRYVIEQISKLNSEPEYFETAIRIQSDIPDLETTAIRRRIDDLESQIGKLLDLYQFNSVPPERIAERIENLSNEKQSLENSLQQPAESSPDLTFKQAQDIAANSFGVLENGDLEERRQIVQSLIRRIDIDENDVYITWRFM
ncbi:recombinase family protein [Anaerotruncus massiliensis (ex Liu et al. 2021)]|uniref:recombinase family protein n=1 Tax=Anaerotruncus massiliensis (ex Liu et al. 2021) TaxID=2321404 RepID=UPI003AF55D3F